MKRPKYYRGQKDWERLGKRMIHCVFSVTGCYSCSRVWARSAVCCVLPKTLLFPLLLVLLVFHQTYTFCRLSLIRHNMMKQFPITSGDSIAKEYLRCLWGMEWTLIKLLPSYTRWSPGFPSQVKGCVLRVIVCCVWGCACLSLYCIWFGSTLRR